MIPSELIRLKRDGEPLSREQIAEFVGGVVDGSIPDYQVSAWLMAVFFRGLEPPELAILTETMMRSGELLDLSDVPGVKADKHSTGGVGDKVTLALAPLAAACGLVAPMIAGRGLGHTGGTIDKLEAIPGFRADLGADEFKALLRRAGTAIGEQTERIAPADRKLYALRDVTATVESIPLIASSIMSKKLAIGSDLLVLDVKTGDGALMSRMEDSLALARAMLAIGRGMGRRVSAMITDMSQPLGWAVGNANEVAEIVDLLRGGGPADLRAATLALTGRMLTLGGSAPDAAAADKLMREALDSGRALEAFRRMIEAQGGDPRVADDPDAVLPRAPLREVVHAERSGYVASFQTRRIGMTAVGLGAGRARLGDKIDPAVGLWVRAKLGDQVEAGDPIFEVAARTQDDLNHARRILSALVGLADEPPDVPPLIHVEDVAEEVEGSAVVRTLMPRG